MLDGILGIGGRPGLPEQAIAWVEAIPDDAYVLAVDLPSGQDPAGETATPDAVFADETVTFGVPKPVHLLPATEPAVGRLTVVDIGLAVDRAPAVQRVTRDDVPRLWPVPSAGDDKYSRGVLGIVAGGEQYTGAALLCTTAAVCSGVGMVRYVGTATPTALVRSGVPEAVIGTGQVQAWVVGPGLDVAATGHGARQLEAARAALGSDLPVLVDAGGLDLVERPRQAPTLLTPHAGELARLISRLTGEEVSRAGRRRLPRGPRAPRRGRDGGDRAPQGGHDVGRRPHRARPAGALAERRTGLAGHRRGRRRAGRSRRDPARRWSGPHRRGKPGGPGARGGGR